MPPLLPTSPRLRLEVVKFSAMDTAVSMVSGSVTCSSQRVASSGAHRNTSLSGLNSPT